jgi:DMSO/TMAO reductase YedYZ molybdopterin-dependent catalytic subunit
MRNITSRQARPAVEGRRRTSNGSVTSRYSWTSAGICCVSAERGETQEKIQIEPRPDPSRRSRATSSDRWEGSLRCDHRQIAPVSRGFRGRRRGDVDASRVPPGQYVVDDFPVLSAGPTPQTSLDEWSFTINGAADEPRSWSWDEFAALPSETFTVDIHCVTKWSKLGTTWTGFSVDRLLEDVDTAAEYISAFCDGGYTTTGVGGQWTSGARGSSSLDVARSDVMEQLDGDVRGP